MADQALTNLMSRIAEFTSKGLVPLAPYASVTATESEYDRAAAPSRLLLSREIISPSAILYMAAADGGFTTFDKKTAAITATWMSSSTTAKNWLNAHLPTAEALLVELKKVDFNECKAIRAPYQSELKDLFGSATSWDSINVADLNTNIKRVQALNMVCATDEYRNEVRTCLFVFISSLGKNVNMGEEWFRKRWDVYRTETKMETVSLNVSNVRDYARFYLARSPANGNLLKATLYHNYKYLHGNNDHRQLIWIIEQAKGANTSALTAIATVFSEHRLTYCFWEAFENATELRMAASAMVKGINDPFGTILRPHVAVGQYIHLAFVCTTLALTNFTSNFASRVKNRPKMEGLITLVNQSSKILSNNEVVHALVKCYSFNITSGAGGRILGYADASATPTAESPETLQVYHNLKDGIPPSESMRMIEHNVSDLLKISSVHTEKDKAFIAICNQYLECMTQTTLDTTSLQAFCHPCTSIDPTILSALDITNTNITEPDIETIPQDSLFPTDAAGPSAGTQ